MVATDDNLASATRLVTFNQDIDQFVACGQLPHQSKLAFFPRRRLFTHRTQGRLFDNPLGDRCIRRQWRRKGTFDSLKALHLGHCGIELFLFALFARTDKFQERRFDLDGCATTSRRFDFQTGDQIAIAIRGRRKFNAQCRGGNLSLFQFGNFRRTQNLFGGDGAAGAGALEDADSSEGAGIRFPGNKIEYKCETV
jgi:hypothetical protein